MHLLTPETKIRLNQISDLMLWNLVIDKHSNYQIGEVAEWKDGPHQKTKHGWVKLSQRDNSQDVNLKRNNKDLEYNRKRLKTQIVSKLQPGIIKGSDPKTLRQNTEKWIEQNLTGRVKTEIGDVLIDKRCAEAIYHHGNKNNFRNKADAVPAIKDVITKGVYLGEAPDYNPDIHKTYYYFAAKIKMNNKEEYVFCRARKSDGDQDGTRLYFHDVFTSKDMLNNKGIPNGGTDQNGQKLTGTPLFKSIIYNFLYCK